MNMRKCTIKNACIWVAAMFLYACGSPQMYEDEINDAVRFHIAEADYLAEEINEILETHMFLGALIDSPLLLFGGTALYANQFEDAIEKLENEILSLYIDSDLTYKQVLEKMSEDEYSDYQDDAKAILKHYNSLNISLSDYEKISNRYDYECWKFKELHTDIEFIFEIRMEDESYTWSCSPLDNSMEEYMRQSVTLNL